MTTFYFHQLYSRRKRLHGSRAHEAVGSLSNKSASITSSINRDMKAGYSVKVEQIIGFMPDLSLSNGRSMPILRSTDSQSARTLEKFSAKFPRRGSYEDT
jgi:ribosomal protein S1